jgi:hypothetical protein
MSRAYLVGALLVAVVAASLGAAVYTGVGPAPGGESGDDIEEFPTGTEYNGTTDETPPFEFTVDSIETCGQTCRDVTATVDNTQNKSANEVTVYTRMFAGENTTETDDLVWEGTEDVGTLAAGDSYTSTERVDLSLQDAAKVDGNDGWITIVTTVESDDETITVRESRQVA